MAKSKTKDSQGNTTTVEGVDLGQDVVISEVGANEVWKLKVKVGETTYTTDFIGGRPDDR